MIEMKGQAQACQQAGLWLAGIEHGGPIRPLMVHGPSGCGKSHLIEQIKLAPQMQGRRVLHIESVGGINRRIADMTESGIPDLFRSGEDSLLILDEAHGLATGSASCVGAWKNIFFPWGNGRPHTAEFPYSADVPCMINFGAVAIILATNMPDALEPRASLAMNERPFRRRLQEATLLTYPREIIGEVIGDMLAARGIKASDSAQGLISRFHRGTLEALSKVIEAFRLRHPDKTVMSREDVIEAAKTTAFLPRGLRQVEAQILQALVDSTNGTVRKELLATRFDRCRESLAYLARQETLISDKWEHTPFVDIHGSVVSVTDSGRKYLSAIRKEGFNW